MKKSVPELKQDIAVANRQIDLAKKSGNKKQLNLGRQNRLDAWRELRDEHGMKPPSHIAKELDKRYGKAKAKETPEFRAERKEKPAEATPKEETMVFTTVELYGKKEAARMARKDKLALERSKRKLAVPEKRPEVVASRSSSPVLAKDVRAWLNTFPEYRKIMEDIRKAEKEEEAASKALFKHGRDPRMPKREIREMAENLKAKRWRLFEAEGKLDLFLKKMEPEFAKQHSFDPELIEEYRSEHQAFGEQRGAKMARIFTLAEQEVIDRAALNVRGKNRMEEGMKEIILERAKALYERLDEPSANEEESMKEIEKAASDPDVDTEGLVKLAVGEENVDQEETDLLVVAVAGELLDRLETRVAALERERAPTAIARREERRKKGPVKLARAETRGKKEKEV